MAANSLNKAARHSKGRGRDSMKFHSRLYKKKWVHCLIGSCTESLITECLQALCRSKQISTVGIGGVILTLVEGSDIGTERIVVECSGQLSLATEYLKVKCNRKMHETSVKGDELVRVSTRRR